MSIIVAYIVRIVLSSRLLLRPLTIVVRRLSVNSAMISSIALTALLLCRGNRIASLEAIDIASFVHLRAIRYRSLANGQKADDNDRNIMPERYISCNEALIHHDRIMNCRLFIDGVTRLDICNIVKRPV